MSDAASRRLELLIDGTIIHAAVKPPGKTSEDFADATNAVVEVWNRGAEQIEREFGKGYFPVRLEHALATEFRFVNGTPTNRDHHVSLLLYLAARAGPGHVSTDKYRTDNVYQWMSDLLTLAFCVPEAAILREATADNGRYRRKLRKLRAADHMKGVANRFEEKSALYENQRREELRALARDIIAGDRRMMDSARKPIESTTENPIAFAVLQARENYSDLALRPVIMNDHVESDTRVWDMEPRVPENLLAREAEDGAEPLRGVFAELQGLSGRKAADELNRRGIKTPGGGRWHQPQVARVRKRLAGRETGRRVIFKLRWEK